MPGKQIPGVEGQVELSWVTDTAPQSPAASANGGGIREKKVEPAAGEAQKSQESQAAGGVPDVAMQEREPDEQAEMDYDVAGEDQWDIG